MHVGLEAVGISKESDCVEGAVFGRVHLPAPHRLRWMTKSERRVAIPVAYRSCVLVVVFTVGLSGVCFPDEYDAMSRRYQLHQHRMLMT
jgi:hypothetical protein